MKNLIAFFEIPVTDFYQSVNFYQAIFGGGTYGSRIQQ